MADGESIATSFGSGASALSLTDALPLMVDGAALLLRVAEKDQSDDGRAAARWLRSMQVLAGFGVLLGAGCE